MIFAKRLRSEDHTRVFLVNSADMRGWEVLEEEDDRIVTRRWLHDWHRVENTMTRFTFAALELERAGWTEIQTPASSVV